MESGISIVAFSGIQVETLRIVAPAGMPLNADADILIAQKTVIGVKEIHGGFPLGFSSVAEIIGSPEEPELLRFRHAL